MEYAYNQDATGAGIYAMSVAKPSRKPKLISNKAEKIESVPEYIEKMSASQDGADYLEAIHTAIDSAENKERTLIYVIGSGLSDTGLLNFADDGLLLLDDQKIDKAIDTIVDGIDDNDLLSYATIVWEGIGEVVEPQSDLPSYANEKIEDIYTKLFDELSSSMPAKVIFKDKKLTSDKSADTSYKVKTTFTPAQTTIYNQTYNDNDNHTFRFADGKDYLVDETAAVNEINNIIGRHMQSPKSEVTITVYASRGGECLATPDNDLIARRLNRISSYFTSKGINQSRIHLENGGFGPEQDCVNGQFQGNEIANKNRKVTIEVKE